MANFLGLNTLLDEIDKTVSDQIERNMNELEKELKKRIFEDQTEENFIGCMLGV